MPETLLATKLYIPVLHPQALERKALLDRMDNELSTGKRLVLVCAPAGYGKTTLVCVWLSRIPNTCWLSLEKSENDPRLFLSYIIAALQSRFHEVGRQAQAILDAPQPLPLKEVLASILNDLSQVKHPIVLVLDDYQSIQASQVHEAVSFLIDHFPPHVHLVITSRSDPPLPLHRYRSRGQMLEIRADDLRFSMEEVSAYIENNAGVSLSPLEVATLENRTEGWAAGLQLAAISLRQTQNAAGFIQSLAGSNRFVLDYLMEEVFNNQSDEIQRFWMETAILDRLCASLCAAVTNGSQESTQAVLDTLERDNLFLISLDDQRQWYRYHHLFQDLLKMRLKQRLPDQIQALHRNAVRWYEANGWISEAVDHSIQGMDYDHAADLVEAHTFQLFAQGKLEQLMGWIQRLPPQLSDHRPWLGMYQAWVLAFAGQNEQASASIEKIIQTAAGDKLSPEDKRGLLLEIDAVRALVAITSGKIQDAKTLAGRLTSDVPANHLFARSVLIWALGFARRIEGDLPRAIEAFREVLEIGKQTNNLWTLSTSYVDLGMALRLSGRLREAEAIYREGLALLQQSSMGGLGFVGRLESFLANVLYEQNKLNEARTLIAFSIRHNELWKNPNHITHAYLTEARILLAMKADSVEDALARAKSATAHRAVTPSLRNSVDAVQVRFWLERGHLADAARWMAEHPLQKDGIDTESYELQALAHVRILIAGQQFAAACKILDELEAPALTAGRGNTLIEILVLKAIATPGSSKALESLESALQMGVPEGYRRVFLDEGAKLMPYLQKLRAHTDLVEVLLETNQQDSKEENILTRREIEILKAMAEGLSNKEIGQKLFISSGTVKAHSASIYRKLEVLNRTGAIARAKDLGLI